MKSILKSLSILFIYIVPVNAACDFMDIGETYIKSLKKNMDLLFHISQVPLCMK